ncbi:MAG: hypothetical protein HYW25_03185 [Candidatus Aenigmarchaeota archaeon]|nr:hypothetical protein [Candidatus Aenigmarchaeota archaeon]
MTLYVAEFQTPESTRREESNAHRAFFSWARRNRIPFNSNCPSLCYEKGVHHVPGIELTIYVIVSESAEMMERAVENLASLSVGLRTYEVERKDK